MRRTFQDLGRAASVHDFVVRAISGHATTSMQEHYSSVSGDEVRTGLANVIAMAGIAGTGSVSTQEGVMTTEVVMQRHPSRPRSPRNEKSPALAGL
jgi:hypothetical protein